MFTRSPHARRRELQWVLAPALVAMFVAACTSTTGSPSPASSGAPGSGAPAGYEAVRAAALEEGEVNVWSENYGDAASVAQLNQAFNEAIGGEIKINFVHLASQSAVTRIVAEHQSSGRVSVDISNAGADTLAILDDAGLLTEYDWVGTFGEKFPKIKARAEQVPDQFAGGKALDFLHNVYVLVYNTDLIEEEELPRRFEDLGDEQYRGRFAVDPRGYPFNIIAPTWGMERVLSVAEAIAGNEPSYIQGSPSLTTAVGAGEVAFAPTTNYRAVAAKSQGQPVDWFAPEETPAQTEPVFVLEGAPHPNAARLFAAWIATDGRLLLEESQGNGLAWADSDSYLGKRLAEWGTKFEFTTSAEDLEQQLAALEEIAAVYQAGGN